MKENFLALFSFISYIVHYQLAIISSRATLDIYKDNNTKSNCQLQSTTVEYITLIHHDFIQVSHMSLLSRCKLFKICNCAIVLGVFLCTALWQLNIVNYIQVWYLWFSNGLVVLVTFISFSALLHNCGGMKPYYTSFFYGL